jgi:hypothetical protein
MKNEGFIAKNNFLKRKTFTKQDFLAKNILLKRKIKAF